jgi:hypothetical protein
MERYRFEGSECGVWGVCVRKAKEGGKVKERKGREDRITGTADR